MSLNTLSLTMCCPATAAPGAAALPAAGPSPGAWLTPPPLGKMMTCIVAAVCGGVEINAGAGAGSPPYPAHLIHLVHIWTAALRMQHRSPAACPPPPFHPAALHRARRRAESYHEPVLLSRGGGQHITLARSRRPQSTFDHSNISSTPEPGSQGGAAETLVATLSRHPPNTKPASMAKDQDTLQKTIVFLQKREGIDKVRPAG